LVQKLCVNSEKIIAIGDSAGSALVLEMLFITHDPSMFEIVIEDETGEGAGQPVLTELPRPAGTVLISPLVTDETTSESWKVNQKHDYITHHTAKVIKKDYFEPCKAKNQEEDDEEAIKSQQLLGIAKLQTGFQAFMSPEVLMYIGNLEVLRDDALQLAMKAEQDGVVWQTVIEDNVHDWFCVREVVKDKETIKRADDTFADFCYRAIGGTSNQSTLATSSYLFPVPTRESSQLEAVKEEDEEFSSDDDDYTYQSDTSPSSLDDFRLSKLSIFDHLNSSDSGSQSSNRRITNDVSPVRTSSSKRNSDIVFV
jgi:hypothetical protein